MKLIVVLTFLLANILTTTGQRWLHVKESFELLCKNAPAELTKISEVNSIIDQVKSKQLSASDCPNELQNFHSILDLEPVISDADDVCSKKKVDQIEVFHSKYIQAHGNDAKATTGNNPIAPAIRDFFVAYSLRVSGTCKKNMINSLILDTRQQLTSEDFEALDSWTKGDENFMFKHLNGPSDYDDLVLVGDLIRLTSVQKTPNTDKIFIQTGSSQLLTRIQAACNKRFKPFYEKLILPLVKLSNIGYNYQGEDLERELREIKTNKEIHQWYEIVYLCQALDDIKLIENEEDRAKTEGLDRKLVKILTKEEAVELIKLNTDKSEYDDGLKQIVYKPEGGNPIDDVIIDENDQNLRRLIRNFDPNKSDLDRIRSKLFSKMGNFLKENLLKGNFKVMVSALFRKKNNEKQAESNSNPRTEMVRAFDDYVQQMTKSNDNPVAGFKQLGKRAYHNAVYLGPSGIAHKAAENTIEPFNYGVTFWRILAVVILVVGLILILT